MQHLRLKHYNQDNMKLLLLEIYEVDEEEEWDIKGEGEEKPQEAAAQKIGRRCIGSRWRWSEARNCKKKQKIQNMI